MNRLVLLSLMGVLVLAVSGIASAESHSDKKVCLDWAMSQIPGRTAKVLQTDTGGTFTSYEDCLAYAKHGTIFQPSALNIDHSVGSLQPSTLRASGFHRNMPIVAVLSISSVEAGTPQSVTDKHGNLELSWTMRDCAELPSDYFGTPPYDAEFILTEGLDPWGAGVRALTPPFSVC